MITDKYEYDHNELIKEAILKELDLLISNKFDYSEFTLFKVKFSLERL